MTTETVWTLKGADIDKDDPSNIAFLLRANGKEYTVIVCVNGHKITVGEMIDACRAVDGHLSSLFGGRMPEGMRMPLPGEFDTKGSAS
jgi:hypothetical protein